MHRTFSRSLLFSVVFALGVSGSAIIAGVYAEYTHALSTNVEGDGLEPRQTLTATLLGFTRYGECGSRNGEWICKITPVVVPTERAVLALEPVATWTLLPIELAFAGLLVLGSYLWLYAQIHRQGEVTIIIDTFKPSTVVTAHPPAP